MMNKRIALIMVLAIFMTTFFSPDLYMEKKKVKAKNISLANEIESTATSSAVNESDATATPSAIDVKPTAKPGSAPIVDEYEHIRVKARLVLNMITNNSMTAERKLKAVWDYLTNSKNISYKNSQYSLSKKSWSYDFANQIMIEKKGNEYGQNALFALLASEIGYDAKLYVGKTWKKKNKGKGKKKLQAFVKISDYYYDVVSQLSGFDKKSYKKKKYGISFFPLAAYDYFHRKPVKGIVKIVGHVYGLNDNGKVVKASKKTTIAHIQNDLLLVNKNGRAQKGWLVKNNKLYYFGGDLCKAARNKTIKGIPFLNSGKAKSCLNTSIKIYASKLIKKITKKKDKKKTKLRKIFKYVSSRKHFHYEIRYPNLKSKSWPKEYANYMLKKRGGNCYGFACTFAALASEIGYNPYIVYGRIRGRRDHAADGYTRHATVKINGKYYDPEANWAGFLHNVFARKIYPMHMKNKKNFCYKKALGSGQAGPDSKKKNKLVKKKKKYYYYDNKGKAVTGTYYIKGKLYKFNKKHYMSLANFKKYQKLIKEKSSFSKLKKYIGNPIKSQNNGASCYALNGEDWVHTYKHFKVYTFKTSSGKEIVVSLGL